MTPVRPASFSFNFTEADRVQPGHPSTFREEVFNSREAAQVLLLPAPSSLLRPHQPLLLHVVAELMIHQQVEHPSSLHLSPSF